MKDISPELRDIYPLVIARWRLIKRELPAQDSYSQFGVDLGPGIRNKIRNVWLLACYGFHEAALNEIDRLSGRSGLFSRQSHDEREDAEWRELFAKLTEACHWLADNLDEPRVCQNPICGHKTYIFRKGNYTKYCHPECLAQAREIRRLRRQMAKPPAPKKRKIGKDTRRKMSQSATRRWKELNIAPKKRT
jgi:hypothetical protein